VPQSFTSNSGDFADFTYQVALFIHDIVSFHGMIIARFIK